MGIFRPGFPLLRRVAGALLARGRYIPAVTTANIDGKTVILTPELVEPKGILRSTTVWAGLGTAATSGTALVALIKAGIPDDAVFQATAGAFVGSLLVIWRHVRSWMPTRGAAAPPT